MGRAVAAHITCQDVSLVCISVYGFAASHVLHSKNEVLLTQIAMWAAGLRLPTIMCGDLNESVHTSAFVALSRCVGMWRLSDSQPTTKKKNGLLATSPPIDHCFTNSTGLDMGFVCTTVPHLSVSDHVPLLIQWPMLPQTSHTWLWPKPMNMGKVVNKDVPWTNADTSYVAWAEKATSWLAATYEQEKTSHTTVQTTISNMPTPPVDHQYTSLLKARKQAWDVHQRHVTRIPLLLLKRCKAMGITQCETIEEIILALDQQQAKYFQQRQENAIKEWKRKTYAWHAQSTKLHHYLRNTTPAKTLLLCDDEDVYTSSPSEVGTLLSRYWDELESCDDPDREEQIAEAIEDVYSICAPNFPYHAQLDHHLLAAVVKYLKKSSPGADGWSREELQALPKPSWANLVQIMSRSAGIYKDSIVSVVRRVPIEKSSSSILPTPSSIRPIDVHSLRVRTVASAYAALTREWTRKITHPTQYATKGGIVVATCALSYYAESILAKHGRWWAVSIDFMKLYNSLSLKGAKTALKVMGMSEALADEITKPSEQATFMWRLPGNQV